MIHFEIPADNAQRAVKFYTEVFGWKILKWEGPAEYWLATTGDDKEPGINGAITPRDENMKSTTNTISVESYEEAAKKIAQAGGKILTPKMAVPGIGYMSYCQDTEGNMFGIMQSDPQAK